MNWIFVYGLKWYNEDRFEEKDYGIVVGESLADATRRIEDFYGADCCGQLQINYLGDTPGILLANNITYPDNIINEDAIKDFLEKNK